MTEERFRIAVGCWRCFASYDAIDQADGKLWLTRHERECGRKCPTCGGRTDAKGRCA